MTKKSEFRVRMGLKIKQLRTEAGMTQVELADQLGLSSNGHVSLIERGERGLTHGYVLRLADIFGVHPSVLFTSAATSLEDARLLEQLSEIFSSEKKPASFKALRSLIEAVAQDCKTLSS